MRSELLALSLAPASPHRYAQDQPADKSAYVRGRMRPEISVEGMANLFRDVRRVILHPKALQKVAADARD